MNDTPADNPAVTPAGARTDASRKPVRIDVHIDAEASTVWIEPPRAPFGRTRIRRAVEGEERTEEVIADAVDWRIRFIEGSPDDFEPVLLFESFSPEPETPAANGRAIAELAQRWDRRRGPCASIVRRGNTLQARGLAGAPSPGQPEPRGFYMYTFGLLAKDGQQDGDVVSVQRLSCVHGPAAGLEPPPEPIGRSG